MLYSFLRPAGTGRWPDVGSVSTTSAQHLFAGYVYKCILAHDKSSKNVFFLELSLLGQEEYQLFFTCVYNSILLLLLFLLLLLLLVVVE